MIFVTVGMQLGFDRLIRAMDELATELEEEVIAQTGVGSYAPQRMAFRDQFPPPEIEQLFASARLIVAHAGVGTVLAARRHSKPLVLLPRRADLDEHRNDHQMATARQLQDRQGIAVAFEVHELGEAIASATNPIPFPDAASPELIKLEQAIAIFIEKGSLQRQ